MDLMRLYLFLHILTLLVVVSFFFECSFIAVYVVSVFFYVVYFFYKVAVTASVSFKTYVVS